MYKYREMMIYSILLAAFFAGILFMNLAGDTYLGKKMLSLPSVIENSASEKLHQTGYLYYLLKIRGSGYLMLGVLGQIIGGTIWMVAYGAWFCIVEGMLLTSGFVQQQIGGVWILILVQIPHMMIYAFVYALLLRSYFELGKVNGDRRKTSEKRAIYFRNWLANFPVMLIGIFAEYYMNPWCLSLLQNWLK